MKEKSQSHRFSEVYFHHYRKGDGYSFDRGRGRNPIALVRSISTPVPYRVYSAYRLFFIPSQSHRFSEVYFHDQKRR